MISGQKLYTDDGIQVLLFPLDRIHITQRCGSSFSHEGSNAMDFIGTHTEYPYYAPCDCTLAWKSGTSGLVYHSDHPVYLVDGTVDYVTMYFGHDNYDYSVGRKVKQGELLGYTGVKGNVTGDHLHLELSKGLINSMTLNPYNVWQLANNICPPNIMFANDTIKTNPLDYNWVDFDGGVVPPILKKDDDTLTHMIVFSLPYMI